MSTKLWCIVQEIRPHSSLGCKQYHYVTVIQSLLETGNLGEIPIFFSWVRIKHVLRKIEHFKQSFIVPIRACFEVALKNALFELHTPFWSFSHSYSAKTVLTLGARNCAFVSSHLKGESTRCGKHGETWNPWPRGHPVILRSSRATKLGC